MNDKNLFPLSALCLTVRTHSALTLRGVKQVGHITRMREREFVKRFGRVALRDVTEGLTDLGLRFRRYGQDEPVL